LAGLVDRVTFHNDENGFCVLRVKARGQRDLITVIGHAAMISAGEFVRASGSWINDRTHGIQFRVSFLKATAPTTIEGIEKYLGSGMIRGIGPVYAKKLVRAFGEAVFEVVAQAPDRLREVSGIGPKRAERIIGGWAEQQVIREIMLFLHSNGVGPSRAVRIYKTYGADAVQLISENPYRLARDIRGIGFRTADQIAAERGIEKTALIRVRAGISFALAEVMDDGHCGLPHEELLALMREMLEVAAELVGTALGLELQDGTVIADDLDDRRCIFLAGLYRAEREIAAKLRALAVGRPPWPSIDAAKAIPWVEKRTEIKLADSQIEAVRIALASKVLVITGGPGVGRRHWSTRSETDPRTGAFRRTEEASLDCDLLVVDETSMVDVPLMRALLRALPDDAALLLVGDVDQLPLVGPGQVLADIIASNAVPVVRLTEVFRQAAESRIIVNAHRINQGVMPVRLPRIGGHFC
jgi:exodeoxyribonuclease V alpha subunit